MTHGGGRGEGEHPLELLLLPALRRLNAVIVAAPSLEAMLTGVLDEMLELFECDRAFFQFPCDPTAPTFTIPMERTRPEWPGAGVTGEHLPMTPPVQAVLLATLNNPGACRCDGVHGELPFGQDQDRFSVRSVLMMAIRPRSGGPPWCLGLHHCAAARVYSDTDAMLFEAIGARLADALTGFLALSSSLADRRRLEEAQHKARIGSYEWRRGQGEAYWSKELYRLLGVAEGERKAMFASVMEAVHPDDRQRLQAQVGRVMRAGGEYEVQVRGLRPNGEEWVMHAWGQAVVNAAGELESMMGVAQDVTERVAAEELQRQLEAELRQSQKMQAVGQLTGGVAHDFNNLLTVILGNLDEIRDQVGEAVEAHELIDHVQRAATQAAELTQRLTAFSRQQPLQPRVVDVGRLVTSLESLLRRTLGVDIAIEVRTDEQLWACEVDPTQLENALLNLAVNARDAMPNGGRLTITTSNVALAARGGQPGALLTDCVLVQVKDDGAGMPEAVLSRAFDPFFTTKGPGRGTGLGLSMVYGFVKQSGGHVELTSALGAGTTVGIFLPRSVHRAHPAPLPRPVSADVRGRGERILVVEDDPRVRPLTVRMLERLGYAVYVAEDGPMALQILQAHSDIALLFTDIVLPKGMNGVELARQARAFRPELPVLYTSGYTDNAVIRDGRVDPDVQLLDKPFTRAALARHIHQALSGAVERG
ncbi:MAG TPA: ATP-binding protein [Polyangiaceae bacterium]|nr:ATP-binding protein [Polyangiaceae bacterium]